jgi:hypothetical protein
MPETNQPFNEIDCPLAVLTANYGNQLAVAMNDPPVTWASDAGWIKAKNLVDQYGDLPVYIRGSEEESEGHFVTHLGIVGDIAESNEYPEHAEELKQYLVEDDAMHEGEDEYSHYIRVDECWELEEPFSQDELVLEDRPVKQNYSRNYAIVQPREEDV